MTPEQEKLFRNIPRDQIRRDPEFDYLLSLRATLMLAIREGEGDGEMAPPAVAINRLARFLDTLYTRKRLTSLPGTIILTVQPRHRLDRLALVFETFLNGGLIPTDAATEIAIADLVEETMQAADTLVRGLYEMVGKPLPGRRVVRWLPKEDRK
jgi:hypothetical protein